MRRELLVGFDPLPLLVEALEGRWGFLAAFCADYVGGCALVGLKWRAAAFAPGPLRPERAYALRALGPASAKSSKGSGAAAVGATVPDVAAVVDDILALGAGLVESVEVLRVPLAQA